METPVIEAPQSTAAAPAAPTAAAAPQPNVSPEPSSITTYISSLTQASPESTTQTGNLPPSGSVPEQDPALQQSQSNTIEQIAAEYGLNPNDPKHRQILEKLAPTDPQPAAAAASQPQEPVFDISVFESELLNGIIIPEPPSNTATPPTTEHAQPVSTAAQPVAPGPGQTQGNPSDLFNDGFTWNDPSEAYKEKSEAWDSGDLERYQKVDLGIQQRVIAATVPHFVQPLIAELKELRSIVHEIAPDFKKNLANAQLIEAKEHAMNTLAYSKDGKPRPGFENFLDMWKDPEDKATIKIGDEVLPAKPINRIVAQNPWIRNIQDSDPNPVVRQRKTMAMQLMAAYKIYRHESVKPLTPSAAAEIFDAGRTASQQSRRNDPVQPQTNRPAASLQPTPTANSAVGIWFREMGIPI